MQTMASSAVSDTVIFLAVAELTEGLNKRCRLFLKRGWGGPSGAGRGAAG